MVSRTLFLIFHARQSMNPRTDDGQEVKLYNFATGSLRSMICQAWEIALPDSHKVHSHILPVFRLLLLLFTRCIFREIFVFYVLHRAIDPCFYIRHLTSFTVSPTHIHTFSSVLKEKTKLFSLFFLLQNAHLKTRTQSWETKKKENPDVFFSLHPISQTPHSLSFFMFNRLLSISKTSCDCFRQFISLRAGNVFEQVC